MTRFLALILLLAACSSSQSIAKETPNFGDAPRQAPTPQPTYVPDSAGPIEGGVASFVGPEYGPTYLALPEGPGVTVRICGEACVTRTSTDAGPSLAMQREGRIADVSFADFAVLCACDPWVVGLFPVTVERGANPTPPQTDSGGTR